MLLLTVGLFVSVCCHCVNMSTKTAHVKTDRWFGFVIRLSFARFQLASDKGHKKQIMPPPTHVYQPMAPKLGSFPLDHFRECKPEVAAYYKCLEAEKMMPALCRDETRTYIQCRMDKGLMDKQDIDAFGIPRTEFVPSKHHKQTLENAALRVNKGSPEMITAVWAAKYKDQDLLAEDGFERREDGTVIAAPPPEIDYSIWNMKKSNPLN